MSDAHEISNTMSETRLNNESHKKIIKEFGHQYLKKCQRNIYSDDDASSGSEFDKDSIIDVLGLNN